MSETRSVKSNDRPVARDPERHLFALLLRHPVVARAQPEILDSVDVNDILDSRHRELLRAFMENLAEDDILALLPESISDYASALREEVPERKDWSPGLVQKDLKQAAQTLARTRHLFREAQVKRDLSAAKAAGDQDEVMMLVRHMTLLAQRRSEFDPETSPYFKDSRTVNI